MVIVLSSCVLNVTAGPVIIAVLFPSMIMRVVIVYCLLSLSFVVVVPGSFRNRQGGDSIIFILLLRRFEKSDIVHMYF